MINSPYKKLFSYLTTIVFLMVAVFSVVSPMVAYAQDTEQSKPIVPCGNIKDSQGRIVDECSYYHVVELINNLIGELIKYSFPIAALMFGWAGFIYMTNPNSPGKRDEAKKIFTNVFIGFAIIVGAWLVVSAIANTIINKEATTTNTGESTVPIKGF